MTNRNALAAATISFTLALNASVEDVTDVINNIQEFFGITNDAGTVSPAEVAAVSPATNVTNVVNVAAAAPAGDLDKNGFPWDERIHASTKAKNADGTWRYRKGVDDATKRKVEGQLKGTMQATNAPVTPATTAATPTLALPGANLPGVPSLPAVNTENPAYTNFVKFIAEHTQSPTNPTGRLSDEWVKQALTAFGVAEGSIQNLAHRPDLIPQIEAAIKQALGIA